MLVLVLVLDGGYWFSGRFEYEYRFAEYEYRFAEYEYRFAEYESEYVSAR